MSDQKNKPKTKMVKFDYNADMPVQTRMNLHSLLTMFSSRLQDALPPGAAITKAGLIEAALLAAAQKPQILQCTQGSILESVLTSARFGLDCSGALRSAYLVPFRNRTTGRTECKLIIGYGGFLDLAHRAADTTDIDVQLIYQDDDIDIVMGTSPKVRHTPRLSDPRTPDRIIGSYMVATYRDGTQKVEYMSRQEVDRIRARSKAKDDGPWNTDTGEMTRKTVLRRGIKYLPISVIEAGQLLAEAERHDNETAGIAKQLDAEPGARLAALKAHMDSDGEQEEEPIDVIDVEVTEVLKEKTGAAGKHAPPPDEPWVSSPTAPYPDPIDDEPPTSGNLFDEPQPPAAAH